MATATTPARALPPDEKRQLIFQAAREVIIDRGFDAAKMEEIAARAGVGKGTLYNFFASKEDLFLSLVLDSFERTRDLIDAEVEPIEDPWSRIEVAWRTLMLRVFPDLVRQWNFNYQLWGFVARDREARERLFAHWRELYREREERMVTAIEQGQRDGHFRRDVDAPTLSLLLLSIFDGILHRSMFDAERIDAGAVVDGMVDLMRSVLSPRGEEAR
jgi:AcrR family transcriptional regulator